MIPKNTIFINFVILLSLMYICSCTSINKSTSHRQIALPETFNNSLDTVNTAHIDWKSYFFDTLLIELIDTALKNNLDLAIALQRIEVARASIRSADADLLPAIGLNASAGVRKYGLYTMDGAGNISTEITPGEIVPIHLPDYYIGLQASWELDVWGKLRNRRKAAVSDYLASVEGTHFVITNLTAEVAINYYELIALDNELDIIRQTIQNQLQALEAVRVIKDVGRANELAVQQFQAQLLETQALENDILQKIFECENRINGLLGRFPQPINRQKEIHFSDGPAPFEAGIPSQLLRNRPDIREAELQLQAAKYDLKAAKAAFLPSFNIFAGYGFQAFKPEFLLMTPASVAYTALGNLLVPVINRNALKAQFNRLKAGQEQALFNYQSKILSGYVEVVNNLNYLQNLERANALRRQQAEVLANSVETSTELFRTAKATYLEVLIAQQNALRSNLARINTLKLLRITRVNLYRALGGGWR